MQNVYCSREGIKLYVRGVKKIWKSSMLQKTGRKQLKIQPTRKGYIHHKNKMFCKERLYGDS